MINIAIWVVYLLEGLIEASQIFGVIFIEPNMDSVVLIKLILWNIIRNIIFFKILSKDNSMDEFLLREFTTIDKKMVFSFQFLL